MISNQILQSTIKGVKDISRVDLYVADTDGKIVASTSQIGNQFKDAIIAFAGSPADSQSVQGYQFFKVYDENQLELILIAQGANDDVFMIGKMAAFQIQNLLVAYKERFDKDNFIKNLHSQMGHADLVYVREAEGVAHLRRIPVLNGSVHFAADISCRLLHRIEQCVNFP